MPTIITEYPEFALFFILILAGCSPTHIVMNKLQPQEAATFAVAWSGGSERIRNFKTLIMNTWANVHTNIVRLASNGSCHAESPVLHFPLS